MSRIAKQRFAQARRDDEEYSPYFEESQRSLRGTGRVRRFESGDLWG
ncbi:hypothetical protein AKJ09_06133 [Labilithrix luteola]|uniref:Uncharacterized protein n=1 Tax=Labilithrix luteola TaxID=1391654 RepID=A0A0K1Q262_9BACT|nr:hypothetical protein AKJ09_06133 [Labilithrix luteola]